MTKQQQQADSEIHGDQLRNFLVNALTGALCLTLMQAHNLAYVVPIIAWGNEIQQELSEGWNREIEHDLETRRSDPQHLPTSVVVFIVDSTIRGSGVSSTGASHTARHQQHQSASRTPV